MRQPVTARMPASAQSHASTAKDVQPATHSSPTTIGNVHWSALGPQRGVLVLSGYGVHVGVERGQLSISDGVGRERRAGRLSKATSRLKRLVILGHAGTISFEALRWLHDLGAAFIQIDADGNVICASAPARLDDARLRRAQAVALWNGVGSQIARDLLRHKMQGQAAMAERIVGPDAEPIRIIHQAVEDLAQAGQPEPLRVIEAAAAAAYWGAWAEMPVRFARRDEPKVPAHWHTVGSRTSPITGAPRSAANPANALFNYLYAILEAEARIAALTVGLDPGLGVMHADQRGRDSLACDLMEAVRPQVDAFVLDTLTSRTFTARDFFENRQGVCRLMPPLTHLLAETAPTWAKAIAPLAEDVARTLYETRPEVALTWSQSTVSPPKKSPTARADTLPTPLTQARRSAGRAGVRRRTPRQSASPASSLPQVCRMCGGEVPNAERLYCDRCLAERRAEIGNAFVGGGADVLAQLRAEHADPAHGGEAAQKRGQRLLRRQQEQQAWEEREGGLPDGLDFTRDILPGLQQVPLATLIEHTGLSRRYCWLIKTGQKTPHRRHFSTLMRLGT